MSCAGVHKSPLFRRVLRISLLLLASVQIRSDGVAASTLQAFEQFLHMQHLKHGIIVTQTNQLRIKDLQDLVSRYHIRFFNMATATGKSATNFDDYFYTRSPRVGIYVSQLENEWIRNNLLSPNTPGDYFNNSQAWFMMAESCDWQLIRATLEPLEINVNADITLAIKLDNNSLALYDVFKYCHACGQPLQIESKGSWISTNGFVLHATFLKSFVKRRRNFNNMSLKTVTVIREKPANYTNLEFLMVQKYKQFDAMQRKTYNLVKIMEPLLNMSFNITIVDNWGGPATDGNWTGMFNEIHTHKVELSLCPLRYTLERVHTVQFTPVIHTEYLLFLFRHPRRIVIRNIFFQPFSNVVWWSTLSVITLAICLLAGYLQHEYRQLRWRQQQQQHKSQQHDSQLQFHRPANAMECRFDYALLLISEAIFMQGPAPSAFHCTSTRLLITSTCIFSVMLLQFYSGYIVGSLLAVAPRSITTLAALYNSSLEIGMEDVQYQYDIFKHTTNPIGAAIFAKRICSNRQQHILPMQKGVERVGRGGFAFHVSIDRAYRILKSMLNDAEFCELQEIGLYPYYTMAIIMRKTTPYREHFANTIIQFKETGLLQYNDKLWQVSKPDCNLNKDREVKVDLEHFLPALVFLAMAMLGSLFILLLECIFSRLPWRSRQKNSIAGSSSKASILLGAQSF